MSNSHITPVVATEFVLKGAEADLLGLFDSRDSTSGKLGLTTDCFFR